MSARKKYSSDRETGIERGTNVRILYKLALRVLIGAVGISAVLGIYALLRQDLDDWTFKIIGTTLFVSATSLLIMVNAAGFEKRSVGYFLISGTGMLAALGALPVFLYALWREANNDDDPWRFAATLAIISVVAGHTSLLSLRPLSAQYRWLKPIAAVLAGALGVLVIWMFWYEKLGSAELRTVGVLSILLVSVTIAIPILSISRLTPGDDPDRAGRRAGRRLSDGVHYCPNCGRAVRASGENRRCGECGARFAVRFRARH
ncbi:MAG: hypothetical protein IIC99_11400 [Chloroflexi bacterium]|nr:hypothetical protein [Chloroflexota bacterium]